LNASRALADGSVTENTVVHDVLIELPLKKYQPVISKARDKVAHPVPVRFCVIPPISFETCWARSPIESVKEFIISPFQSGIF